MPKTKRKSEREEREEDFLSEKEDEKENLSEKPGPFETDNEFCEEEIE